MIKRTIGLLAALTIALGSAVTCFADAAPVDAYDAGTEAYLTETETETNTDTDTGSAEAENYGAASTAEDISELFDTEEEVVEFAEQNEDPQLGKHLDMKEDFDENGGRELDSYTEPGGGPSPSFYSSGYNNTSLVHQARFDGTTKRWGIDVSYYQYDIDWNKVKAEGIQFAIIRAGYRGYGYSGDLVQDPMFDTYMKGAIAAGLDVGVYFYTQAITYTEAVEEADFVLSMIKNYNITMPVYYDIESVDYASGRLDNAGLTYSQKTGLCTSFCNRIISKGYDSGVYANKNWLMNMIDGEALGEKYPIWLAHYTSETDYDGEFGIWQFTGQGTIDGINTYVDLDVEYYDPSKEPNTPAVPTVPVSVPTGFVARPSGSNTVFSWNEVENAEGYQLFTYDATTKKYTLVRTVAGTTYTVKTPEVLTAYCVRAYNTIGNSYFGTFTSPINVSSKMVYDLTASSGDSSITLKWSSVQNAVSYKLYYATGDSDKYTLKCILSSSSTSYTHSKLTSSTVYKYKIVPYFTVSGKKTAGLDSNIAQAATKPPVMGTVNITARTTSSITFKWAAVKGATGYQIMSYNTSTKKYTFLKATLANTVTVTGLSPTTTYVFALRTFYKQGDVVSYGAYTSPIITTTTPATPTGLFANIVNGSPATVKLTWNKVVGANRYAIYRKTGASSNYGYVLVAITSNANPTYTFTDSAADACSLGRVYRVRTIKQIGGTGTYYYGGYSDATIVAKNAPAVPRFTSAKSTANSITLTWNKAAGATGYKLYIYDDAAKSYKDLCYRAATNYTVTGLKRNTTYRFVIRSYTIGTSTTFWGSNSTVYTAKTSA